LRVAGCEVKLCVNLVKTLIRAGYQYQGVDADGKVIFDRNLVVDDEKRGDAARQSFSAGLLWNSYILAVPFWRPKWC
jgi:hypothetical protein